MGPDLARQFQRLRFDVDGDHLRRGGGPCDLNRDMTEAADADQHAGGAGRQLGPGATDRVVGRKAGVGQRRRGRGVKAVGQSDQMALVGNQQIIRHAAVEAQAPAADQRRAFAVVLDAHRAALA